MTPDKIPTATSTAAPPSSDRQKPEDWQNWPVIPVVSARARQIYQTGLALGTNPMSFSKVGDCQAIKDVLLGRYDKPGSYTLRENAAALEETIQYFKGSFDRDGESVQGGFNAASVLTPLMSNPDVCDPGETPLECEVRVHNPSIMLISLEVWWNGRSPDVYEKNMRQIIDFALDKGILPILSTKADNVEGDHSINLATARLAYEYDLPLWNWWKAAQSLPNRGLDPNRPDGFHISQEYAWPERSFTALQVLDAVWRGVRTSTEVQADVPARTSTPQEMTFNLLQSSTASPDSTVLAGEGIKLEGIDPSVFSNPEGFILLSTARRVDATVTPLGIFLINPADGSTRQISPAGSSLQAVSPDGRQILFNRGADLFLAALDGSQPKLLTNRFLDRGSTSVAWLSDGKSVVFLAEQGDSSLLVLYPLDGSGWKRLSPAGVQPVALFPSGETGRVFWEAGNCQTMDACQPTGVYVSGLDGSSAEFLPGAAKVEFSTGQPWMAVESKSTDGKSQISLATMDLKTLRPLENIGDILLDFSWSPDGTRLSLLTLQRSDYSGQWLDVRNLVINTQDMGTKILPSTSGMNPRAVWSPDSRSLLLTGTLHEKGTNTIQFRIMDAASGGVRDFTSAIGLIDQDFIYTTRIMWVKP
ncbi:MAG: hypothetical protein GYA15_16235 [Leptolinea sp.]|nr:hypothetical protein [Leptolinea sp.]